MNTNRRLAAIMVADVVGYSRLMEADEARTLATLKERRKDVFEPVVRAHGGRIVKVMGDGVLVEFGSAVNAVQGAIELQKKMAVANEGVDEAKQVVLRIGINLGDVIGEGSDIYGEGVNIAARLESLAEPGGICVSSAAYDQVRKKAQAEFEDIGLQSLKNIAEPVKVYRITGAGARLSPSAVKANLPAVAVMPFDNMSGDPEQAYFSDGISEDIIAELSRFKDLLVIARNSSFAFKGQAVDLREVGRRLGAQFVVEGSVRRAGNRVRITAQLIETGSGNHVWSERFDRELDDIFVIQDQVATAVVGKVAGQVQLAGIERARRRTGNLTAYDYYLKGLEHVRRGGLEDNAAAIAKFSRAIAEDPNFAQAYAFMSHAQTNYAMSLWEVEDYTLALQKALEWAQRSLDLDGNDARCHGALGQAHFAMKQFDLAEFHIARARSINPCDPDVIALQCYLAAYGDHPEHALPLVELAQNLSPLQPNWYYEPWGVALYQLGRYAEAADVFERALASQPYALRYLAACYAQSGETAKARVIAEKSMKLQPDFSLLKWQNYEQYRSEVGLQHMLEGLRKAGLPE